MKRILLTALWLTPVCMFAQNRYDVLIDEIMADPSPSVGLPGNEWIELRNVSSLPLNLGNWRIGDASGQSGPLPVFTLQPDSFVILCSGSAAAAMSAYGRVLTVSSFPSLDNDGDLVYLRSAGGIIIHAVAYSISWYRNELKKEGGWTLEMIDPANPCGGKENWTASTGSTGGSPGRLNSADSRQPDTNAPQLLRSYTTDSLTIVLVFNEPVDSLSGADLTNYRVSSGTGIRGAIPIPPLFNEVRLQINTALVPDSIYKVFVSRVSDCRGNTIVSESVVRTGRPRDPVPGDWIVNEILFNPRSNAEDFVEMYNKSRKILDASRLYIATRNAAGLIISAKPLSPVPWYIFPGDHLVETEDPGNLSLQYLVKNPDQVLAIGSPPSFPDDKGTVVLLNLQGEVVDEVSYSKDWHFKLLNNPEGVSLERIDPAGPSTDPLNWHSASSGSGYATPTAVNSQFRAWNDIRAEVTVSPAVFSPDNDGRDDFARLQYVVEEPGFMARVTIFDAAGRPVRRLVPNELLGLQGYWNWDGLDERGAPLPVGVYIFLTEMFNLQGKKKQFKQAIVLARFLK